jgi:hypothetical protein
LPAASNGDSDRITNEAPVAAVQVDPDPHPETLTGDASGAALGVAKLSTSVEESVSNRAETAREVARFEQVLTVALTDGTDRIAAKTTPNGVTEVQPAPTEADDTSADMGAAPVIEVELPISDGVQSPPEVARFEQLLTVRSTDGTDQIAAKAAAGAMPEVESDRTPPDDTPAAVEAASVAEAEVEVEVEIPTTDEARASKPIYVAAHALRAAFWFEQSSAFKSDDDDDEETSQPDLYVADSSTSNLEPDPCDADAQPCVEPNGSGSVDPLWIDQTLRHPWVTGICLLALIALVAVLTGRNLRRS